MNRLDNIEGAANPEPIAQANFEAVDAALWPSSSVIAAVDIDWETGRVFTGTLAANTTFTFSNELEGPEIEVLVTNTADNWTVTWPGSVTWPAGSAPTQTVGVKTDRYWFRKVGAAIYGRTVQNY